MGGLKLVNLWQSKEDRRSKYWLARSLGMNSSWARIMADWRLSKIERLFHLTRSNKFVPECMRAQAHIYWAQPYLFTIHGQEG